MDPETTGTALKEQSLWGYVISAILGGGITKIMGGVTEARKSGVQNDMTLAGGWQEMYREVKNDLAVQRTERERAERECKGQIELLSSHVDELRKALRSDGNGSYMA